LVDIDHGLLAKATRVLGASTMREAVNGALAELVAAKWPCTRGPGTAAVADSSS
jgi:Arc/MetJ family transcription regulator